MSQRTISPSQFLPSSQCYFIIIQLLSAECIIRFVLADMQYDQRMFCDEL